MIDLQEYKVKYWNSTCINSLRYHFVTHGDLIVYPIYGTDIFFSLLFYLYKI